MKASLADPAAAVSVRIAGGMLARARGLLWHPDPAPGRGLLLAGVRAVHGFGLPRPLDLVYLDGEGRVLACAVLAPWRIARCAAACHVIELQRGECQRLRLLPGRSLQVTVVDDIFGRSRSPDARLRAPAPARARNVIAVVAITVTLAVVSCLASEAAPRAQAAVNAAPAETATVDRLVGEPRRNRVGKARASVHRDAADGTPAKPLRKARPRRPKGRQAPVEYLVGEPGRHAARSPDRPAQVQREDEPARRP